MANGSNSRPHLNLSAPVFLVAFLCAAAPGAAFAQDTWTSVTTPNVTVLSNGSERSTRNIALQFERIRLAIVSTWPWARVELDRPIVVLAARDEQTMKLLAPRYWERGSQIKPTAVFSQGPDRHYIALRADVKADDNPNENPYHSAYWSYASLLLNEAFDPPLPLWLRNGLAGVLANSIVRDNWVEFGRPFSAYVRTFASEPRLTLAQLVKVTSSAPYYTNSLQRHRFDSQSWAVVEYLLYGRPEGSAKALDNIVSQLAAGKTSEEAIATEFGSIDALDGAINVYVQNGLFKYERVNTASAVDERTLTTTKVNAVDVRGSRLGFHVAMNEPAAARALIAESVKQTPDAAAWFDAEGVLLEREGKTDEARQAYARAVELGSTSAFTLYRSAALERISAGDSAALSRREALLKRAVAANGRMAAAHALLADTYSSAGRRDAALASARTAVSVDPRSVYARLTLARAMVNSGQRDAARGHLLAACNLADTDQERTSVQAMLDGLERSAQPAPAAVTASPSAAAAPASAASPASAPATPAGPTGAASSNAGQPAAARNADPTPRRFMPALRPVGAGETRVLGMFQAIQCRGGGDARIALVVETSGKVMRFAAPGFADVNFMSFRSDTPAQVNCSPFAKPLRALATYRAGNSVIPGADGTAIAIELIPDDFTPPQ